MTTEYVWNELRVRRDENGKWEYQIGGGRVWVHCDDNTPGTAIAAELDKLYPLPRTVTLDNGDVWTWSDGTGGWDKGNGLDVAHNGSTFASALKRIWELENGNDR